MVRQSDREVPYCTICLVVGAIICHSLVLYGNLQTATALDAIGTSTGGWSNVGLSLSGSLEAELDTAMQTVTSTLSQAIEQIQQVQNGIDSVMSVTGSITEEAISTFQAITGASGGGQFIVTEPTYRRSLAALNSSKVQMPKPLPSVAFAEKNVKTQSTKEVVSLLQTPQGLLDSPSLPNSAKVKRVIFVSPNAKAVLVKRRTPATLKLIQYFRKRQAQAPATNSSNTSAVSAQMLEPLIAVVHNRITDVLQGVDVSQAMNVFLDEVHNILSTAVSGIMSFASQQLQNLFQLIHPVLLQIGRWLTSFSDRVSSLLESFSTSIDRVQKVFDQLMSQMSQGAGEGEEQMRYDTFTLFDASNTGGITAQDLTDVAGMYGISALEGSKGPELLERYDRNNDSSLDEQEFANFVHDDSIPGAMSTILRRYAQNLAQIAGRVGAANLRDEVASAVVEYLSLVCAKNMTKVGWVSNALTNRSLPMPFTADILKNLAMQQDNPAILTTQDVGQIIVTAMCRLEPDYVVECLNLMSDPAFWESEGFNMADQEVAVERVTNWVTNAMGNLTSGDTIALFAFPGGQARHHVRRRKGEHPHTAQSLQQLKAMPLKLKQLVRARRRNHTNERSAALAEQQSALFGSGAAQALQSQLLGGTSAAAAANDPAMEQVSNSGVPARPETLLFASRLSSNATATANRFQQQCFDYSQTSSSAVDNFATQIQNMIRRTQSFLNTMQQYATPEGIARLETVVQNFTIQAANDVSNVLMNFVEAQINQSVAAAGGYLDSAITTAQGAVDSAADTAQGIIEPASMNQKGNDKAVALATKHRDVKRRQEPGGAEQSGIFATLQQIQIALQTALPGVVTNLKDARRQISTVASTLGSIFGTFQDNGPPIFTDIAFLYRTIWIAYFAFFATLTMGILLYGFWSSGWFGGPKATVADSYEPPRTCWERCAVCCRSCNTCMKACHDSHLCFWSFCILMQVLVLVIFVISIVLCIVTGIKAFISAGCSQIYLLHDNAICSGMLGNIRGFLLSFLTAPGTPAIDLICNEGALLTCALITSHFQTGGIGVMIGSLVSAVISYLLIVESAILHERARWKRIFDEENKDV